VALSNYMRIKVTVPGDPKLMAGTVVVFNTYGINPTNNPDAGRDPDPLYSGKYLVAACRHIVKNNGYITVMELVKDSNQQSISGSSSALTKYANGIQT
jgi:hypothetical protein